MALVATAIYIAVLSGVGLWFIHKERVAAQKREAERRLLQWHEEGEWASPQWDEWLAQKLRARGSPQSQ